MNTPEKAVDEKFCSSCGSVIKKEAEICPKCGVRQMSHFSSIGGGLSGDKNRMVAALLAFFLGGIGAHKFYLGRTGTGILYLCFVWSGIPSIIGLIEGIIYLTKSDAEFKRFYS